MNKSSVFVKVNWGSHTSPTCEHTVAIYNQRADLSTYWICLGLRLARTLELSYLISSHGYSFLSYFPPLCLFILLAKSHAQIPHLIHLIKLLFLSIYGGRLKHLGPFEVTSYQSEPFVVVTSIVLPLRVYVLFFNFIRVLSGRSRVITEHAHQCSGISSVL